MVEPITAGIAIAGLASSVAGSSKANDEAKAARREQAALTREDLKLRREYMDRQNKVYGPLEEMMVADVMKDTKAETAGVVSSEIEKAYADAKREAQENLVQQGTDTSGLQAGLMTGIALKKASDKAKGVYEAGVKDDVQQFGRRASILGRYNPAADTQLVSQGLMNYANLQGINAQNATNNANKGYQGAANILGSLANYYAKYGKTGTPQNTTGVKTGGLNDSVDVNGGTNYGSGTIQDFEDSLPYNVIVD